MFYRAHSSGTNRGQPSFRDFGGLDLRPHKVLCFAEDDWQTQAGHSASLIPQQSATYMVTYMHVHMHTVIYVCEHD